MRLSRMPVVALALALWPVAAAAQEPAPEPPDSAAATPRGTGATADADGASPEPPEAVGPDSAAVLRAALERPPGQPAFDAVDAVTLPFEVATYPLYLVVQGGGELANLLSGAGPPPGYIQALRDVRRWGLQPGIGSVGPRSGPALTLGLDRWTPFFLESAISVRESQHHRAGLRWGRPGDASGGLEASFGFQRDAEPHFWGLGPDTPEAQRSDFLRDRVAADVRASLPVAPWLALRARGGWEDNRVAGGFDGSLPDLQQRFDPDGIFGADERTEFVRAGVGATLDLARRELFQERGVRLSVDATEYLGTGGTPADFHRLAARFAGYLPVNGRQSLVLRSGIESNGADSGRGVPFTHMATLGDGIGGRAYQDQRFRAEEKLWFSGEWRFEAWRELRSRLGLQGFLFLEEGTAVRDLSALESSDWRPSWGGGLRLVTPAGTVVEAYLAGGEEGTRFQVESGASF